MDARASIIFASSCVKPVSAQHAALNIDRERTVLEMAIMQSGQAYTVELVAVDGSPLELMHAIAAQPGDRLRAVHVIAHGKTGQVLLEPGDGPISDAGTVSKERFAALFSGEPVPLVVLAACHSVEVGEYLCAQRKARAVIATTVDVDDRVALRFSNALYSMLLRGQPLIKAFDFACASCSDDLSGAACTDFELRLAEFASPELEVFLPPPRLSEGARAQRPVPPNNVPALPPQLQIEQSYERMCRVLDHLRPQVGTACAAVLAGSEPQVGSSVTALYAARFLLERNMCPGGSVWVTCPAVPDATLFSDGEGGPLDKRLAALRLGSGAAADGAATTAVASAGGACSVSASATASVSTEGGDVAALEQMPCLWRDIYRNVAPAGEPLPPMPLQGSAGAAPVAVELARWFAARSVALLARCEPFVLLCLDNAPWCECMAESLAPAGGVPPSGTGSAPTPGHGSAEHQIAQDVVGMSVPVSGACSAGLCCAAAVTAELVESCGRTVRVLLTASRKPAAMAERSGGGSDCLTTGAPSPVLASSIGAGASKTAPAAAPGEVTTPPLPAAQPSLPLSGMIPRRLVPHVVFLPVEAMSQQDAALALRAHVATCFGAARVPTPVDWCGAVQIEGFRSGQEEALADAARSLSAPDQERLRLLFAGHWARHPVSLEAFPQSFIDQLRARPGCFSEAFTATVYGSRLMANLRGNWRALRLFGDRLGRESVWQLRAADSESYHRMAVDPRRQWPTLQPTNAQRAGRRSGCVEASVPIRFTGLSRSAGGVTPSALSPAWSPSVGASVPGSATLGAPTPSPLPSHASVGSWSAPGYVSPAFGISGAASVAAPMHALPAAAVPSGGSSYAPSATAAALAQRYNETSRAHAQHTTMPPSHGYSSSTGDAYALGQAGQRHSAVGAAAVAPPSAPVFTSLASAGDPTALQRQASLLAAKTAPPPSHAQVVHNGAGGSALPPEWRAGLPPATAPAAAAPASADPWFVDTRITREAAEAVIARCPVGTFLVRMSGTAAGRTYAITSRVHFPGERGPRVSNVRVNCVAEAGCSSPRLRMPVVRHGVSSEAAFACWQDLLCSEDARVLQAVLLPPGCPHAPHGSGSVGGATMEKALLVRVLDKEAAAAAAAAAASASAGPHWAGANPSSDPYTALPPASAPAHQLPTGSAVQHQTAGGGSAASHSAWVGVASPSSAPSMGPPALDGFAPRSAAAASGGGSGFVSGGSAYSSGVGSPAGAWQVLTASGHPPTCREAAAAAPLAGAYAQTSTPLHSSRSSVTGDAGAGDPSPLPEARTPVLAPMPPPHGAVAPLGGGADAAAAGEPPDADGSGLRVLSFNSQCAQLPRELRPIGSPDGLGAAACPPALAVGRASAAPSGPAAPAGDTPARDGYQDMPRPAQVVYQDAPMTRGAGAAGASADSGTVGCSSSGAASAPARRRSVPFVQGGGDAGFSSSFGVLMARAAEEGAAGACSDGVCAPTASSAAAAAYSDGSARLPVAGSAAAPQLGGYASESPSGLAVAMPHFGTVQPSAVAPRQQQLSSAAPAGPARPSSPGADPQPVLPARC
jgi:hypothetical protein